MRIESHHVFGDTPYSVKDGANYAVFLNGEKVNHLVFMADEERGEVLAHEFDPDRGLRIVDGKPVELRLTGKVEIRSASILNDSAL